MTKETNQQDSEFNSLIQEHLTAVYRVCFLYLKNDMDAQDAAQETFIKAWKNFSRFDQTRQFKSWVCAIAKNTCLDMLKKKKVIPASSLSESELSTYENQAALTPSSEEKLDTIFSAAWVQSALSKLSAPYREVLNLYYERGLNFREIGNTLGVPIDTVKSRHRRAIFNLKKLLDLP